MLERTAVNEDEPAGMNSVKDSTCLLIKNNLNAMGGFIYSNMSTRLDSVQIASLDSLGIKKWIPQKQ